MFVEVKRRVRVRRKQGFVLDAHALLREALLHPLHKVGAAQEVKQRARQHLGAGDLSLVADGRRRSDSRAPVVERDPGHVAGEMDVGVRDYPLGVPLQLHEPEGTPASNPE